MKALKLELDESSNVIQTIRAATGLPDEEWLKASIAIYYSLLCHTSDNTIRFLLENGRVGVIALTHEADDILIEELGTKAKADELNDD